MEEKDETKKMGEGGLCICPKCGTKTKHLDGIPCKKTKCPKCDTIMIRKGSEHDENQKK
ncbi:MAG: ferredoxin [Bacteroidota bacterium]|nr:ferredoxin [Bacteroidota bacterium]